MAERGDIWVLADDRPGTAGQCLGVADAFGAPYAVKRLSYGPLAALPNALLGATFAGLDAESRASLVAPWPGIVIAAGRRTAPAARRIKRAAGGGTFLVQVMDPGPGGRGDFDLIAVPRHDDGTAGPNILPITGAPHRLTAELMEEAAEAWRDRFSALPLPRIGLLVGGGTRRKRFGPAMARDLGAQCGAMANAAGGSLLVTTSRRTGAAAEEALIAAIDCPAYIHRWSEGDGENPYDGILGLADGLVVTGDSVSMCSEAAGAGRALYVFAPPGLVTAKHARFHAGLFAGGYARPFTGAFEKWTHAPLDSAGEIAGEMHRRLDARGTAGEGAA